jgi:24-methylenesterol C-methyltransferase
MTSSAVVGDIVAKLENPTVKWVAVGAGVSGAAYLAMKVSWFRKNPFHSFGGKTGAMAKDLVNSGINSYNQFFDQEDGKGVGSRILSTPEFVDKFYSLITDFYEYGWGESFHFAAREIGESFEASIIRQETAIAETIGLKPGMRALDIGCGVGGPMRNIVKATGGHVTGITINEYQVGRCLKLNKEAGVSDLTDIKQGDFMDLDKVFPAESFDGAYAIEAACHASNTAALYKKVFTVLKPGALFSSYEWLRTNKYDKNNKRHVDVVDGIAEGNALPEVRTIEDCIAAAKEAGFEVQYTFDRATTGGKPWQAAMKSARRAAYITHILTGVLEFIRFAPKGTQAVHTMLLKAAVNLEAGGDLGIFSPMYLIVMKKPVA